MLRYDAVRYEVSCAELGTSVISQKEIPRALVVILEHFEDAILERVEGIDDFKYLLSEINGLDIFEGLKSELGDEFNNIFFITVHPNYLGSRLITCFLDYFQTCVPYFVFISPSWNEKWLNSKVNQSHLVDLVKVFCAKMEIDKPKVFGTVNIYGSSRFDLVQSNKGNKRLKRWKIQRKI